jgi:hypothetical protein
MNHRNLLIVLYCMIINCYACSSQSIVLNNRSKFSHEIVGEWELISQSKSDIFVSKYIKFSKDSNAVISSIHDTILYYKYYIKDSTLFLKDINSDILRFPISKLNRDTVIFKYFMEIEHAQMYKRCRIDKW